MCDMDCKPVTEGLSDLIKTLDDVTYFNAKQYNYGQSITGLAKISQLKGEYDETNKNR